MTTSTTRSEHHEPSRSFPRIYGLRERRTLLAREKELTRLHDEVARERRALPWERVEKNYVFDTPRRTTHARRAVRRPAAIAGAALHVRARLGARLHELLVHGRPHRWRRRASGTARRHALVAISRAPLAEIERFRHRMGWQFKWVSLARQRLQPRLRRYLHAGRSGDRRGPLQLRHRPSPTRNAGHQHFLQGRCRARSFTPTRPMGAGWR